MDKDTIRADITHRLKQLPPTLIAEFSQKIVDSLSSLPEYQSAQTIAAYSPFATEPQIQDFITRATSDGKAVYLPFIDSEGVMEMVRDTVPAKPEDINLIIIPCMAYDPKTFIRLGRGGGHYDIYLEQASTTKIIVAFSLQGVPNLITEQHDISADIIVTENGIQRK